MDSRKFVQSHPSGGFKIFSVGYKLSGVRYEMSKPVGTHKLRGGVHFVVTDHGIEIDEFCTRRVGRNGVMIGIDAWGIAVIVPMSVQTRQHEMGIMHAYLIQ